MLHKISKNEKCAPRLIFFYNFFFHKDSDDFSRWKLTLKIRFWHFLTSIFGHLTSLMKKSMPFLWSVELWLQSEMFLSNSIDMIKNLSEVLVSVFFQVSQPYLYQDISTRNRWRLEAPLYKTPQSSIFWPDFVPGICPPVSPWSNICQLRTILTAVTPNIGFNFTAAEAAEWVDFIL